MRAGIHDSSRLLRRFPELRCLEDPQEQRSVYLAAWRSVRWRYVTLILVFISIAGPLSAVGGIGLSGFLNLPKGPGVGLASGAAGLFLGFLGPLIGLRLIWRRLQRAIREQLRSRGLAVCIKCGYDLQGQTNPRCPECGTSFDPKLLNPQIKGTTS